MSSRRHKFKVTDYAALKEAYPKAVKETVVHTHDYSYIAKLLDCELPVPGVEVVGDQTQLELNEGE